MSVWNSEVLTSAIARGAAEQIIQRHELLRQILEAQGGENMQKLGIQVVQDTVTAHGTRPEKLMRLKESDLPVGTIWACGYCRWRKIGPANWKYIGTAEAGKELPDTEQQFSTHWLDVKWDDSATCTFARQSQLSVPVPKWNAYADVKPKGDCRCYVCNEHSGAAAVLAEYDEDDDQFEMINYTYSHMPDFPIVVTHWIQLPDSK